MMRFFAYKEKMENPFNLAREFQTDRSDGLLFMFLDSLATYIKSPIDGRIIHSEHHLGPVREGRRFIPRSSGVYVAYEDEPELRFIYVGQTVNLRGRLHQGHKALGDCPLFLLEIPADKLDEVEASLIKHLKPKLNCKHNRP